MIFDDLPDDVSDTELEKIAVTRFRNLRLAIFSALPMDCLLKPKRVLTGPMLALLDTEMVLGNTLEREDICSLCPETRCPHNAVSDRDERIAKLDPFNTGEEDL